MCKISVIVPIYNVEKYLDRSIRTLINQSLEDIEIILVNDGSIDNSLKVCKKYANIDSRIKVIDKINGGVSSARNIGIEQAKGKYIAFMDPDDFINIDTYEKIYNKIENDKCDMCSYGYVKENGKHLSNVQHENSEKLLGRQEIRKKMIPNIIAFESSILNSTDLFPRSVWAYLYKKEIIDKYDIKFEETLNVGEDFLFNLKYINKINSVSIDSEVYYHYMVNDESAMQKYREDWWEIHQRLIMYIEKEISSEEKFIKEKLVNMKFDYFIGAILNECHKDNKKAFLAKLNKLKSIREDSLMKDVFLNLSLTNLSFMKKIWFKIIKSNNILLVYIYYKIRSL